MAPSRRGRLGRRRRCTASACGGAVLRSRPRTRCGETTRTPERDAQVVNVQTHKEKQHKTPKKKKPKNPQLFAVTVSMLERDKQELSHHAPLHKVIAVPLMWHFGRSVCLQCKQFVSVGKNLPQSDGGGTYFQSWSLSNISGPRCERLEFLQQQQQTSVGCLRRRP